MSGANFNITDNRAANEDGSVPAGAGGGGEWTSYTPVITLVGGTGNIVPQYITVWGEYIVIGKTCTVQAYFDGDGGDEGAGTGHLNISLPVAIGAGNSASFTPIGYLLTGINSVYLLGAFPAGTSTVPLYYITGVANTNVVGNTQSSVTRIIYIQATYRID